MALLILGMVIFLSAHLIPTFVGLRQKLVGWKGETVYLICYALVSALGLALIIAGKATAPIVPIWEAPRWMNHLTMTAMLPSVILIAAAYIPNNLKRFIRHPFLWGFTLWSLSHLLVNGDLGSLVLFGGIGAFAGRGRPGVDDHRYGWRPVLRLLLERRPRSGGQGAGARSGL